MKKLFFLLCVVALISCNNDGKLKEVYAQAKTSSDFIIEHVEFEATQFKLDAYKASKINVNQPFPLDPKGPTVSINRACNRKIAELEPVAKNQFLRLCELASTRSQFDWIFENKNTINKKTMIKALLNNQNFKPDSVWMDFLCKSGSVINILELK